jgi:hypothetical protein
VKRYWPALGLAAPLVFCSRLENVVAYASFALACVAFVVLGRAALSLLYPRWARLKARLGVRLLFLEALVGQLVAVASVYLVGFVGLPLPALCWALLLLAVLRLRSFEAIVPTPQENAFDALVWIGCAVGLIPFSHHLGSIGIDSHQHIEYALQVFDTGSVAIVARSTSIVDPYPRAFHVLAALWQAWSGVPHTIGVFIKAMPFLQGAIGIAALVDALAIPCRRKDRQRLWLVGAAAFVAVFCATDLLEPTPGVGSTARISASGLWATLLLSALLLTRARALGGRLAAFLVPVALGLALAMHPVAAAHAAILLVLAVVPALAMAGRRALVRTHWQLTASAVVLAAIVLQEPLTLGALARSSPLVSSHVAGRRLTLPDEAIRQGLVPRPNAILSQEAPIDWRPSQLIRAATEALAATRRWPEAGGRSFPVLAPLARDWELPWIPLIGGSVAVLCLASRRRPGWIALVALLLPYAYGLSAHFGHQLLERVFRGHGFRYDVFIDYFIHSTSQAGRLLLALSLLAAGMLLPWRLPRLRPLAVLLAAAAALGIVAAVRLQPLERQFFESRLRLGELHDFLGLTRRLDEDDVVLVLAHYMRIGVEDWIVPYGRMASVLPFSRQRLVFNVRNGHSIHFGPKDLTQRLCSSDPEVRSLFLKESGVRYFLVRATPEEAAAAHVKPDMCGLSLRDLGFAFPPRTASGYFLVFERRS